MSRKAQRRSQHSQASEPPKGEARIGPDIQDHIGRHLRAIYDQVRAEPVPDRLLDLLRRLDRTEPEQSR